MMSSKKICIVHLNQIGDLLFSLPLLKALREHFPDALIHSVVKPHLKGLLIDSPYVDSILPRERGLKAKGRLLRTIRKNRYDLLISLARSEECLVLTALSKAKVKAGFSHFPWDLCLDTKETIEGHNSWHNNAKLLKRLNVKVSKNDYVGLLKIDTDKINVSLPEKFVVISPGASSRRLTKTWEQEKFAELIILLKEKHDLTPVLIGGKDNEEHNSRIIENLNADKRWGDSPILNLTGDTLRTISAVIKDACLFVGIDSGFMHLASSLDIPVVGLFGPTDPLYVGPQNKQSIVVRAEEMECVPCYLKACEHRNCMRELKVSDALNACDILLNNISS
jgi:ADP-heptose:LPS heptosyltransferase